MSKRQRSSPTPPRPKLLFGVAERGAPGLRAGTTVLPSQTAIATGMDGNFSGRIGRDRRRSERHDAVEYRLWIAWWQQHEFVVLSAELVNISEGGVLVITAEAPEEGQSVWMRLEGTEPIADVRAVTLEIAPAGSSGNSLVRLQFTVPCPANFYETAVAGLCGQCS
jgi:hypothetical protein